VFGDDYDVSWGYGGYIPKSKDMFVFIDYLGRYFLAYEFVEDGLFCH